MNITCFSTFYIHPLSLIKTKWQQNQNHWSFFRFVLVFQLISISLLLVLKSISAFFFFFAGGRGFITLMHYWSPVSNLILMPSIYSSILWTLDVYSMGAFFSLTKSTDLFSRSIFSWCLSDDWIFVFLVCVDYLKKCNVYIV